MSKYEVRSHRGKLPADKLARLQESREWVDANHEQITLEALEHLAQLRLIEQAIPLLKNEREKRGLTLTEVAQRAGIDKGQLSRLENGVIDSPRIDTLRRIAEALGGSLLVGFREGDPSKPGRHGGKAA